MKKFYLFFAMVMIIAVVNSQNIVNQQWVQYYNGPDSLNDGSFSIDYEGNVYVTGASQVPPFTPQVYKITTIKYNSSGALLWVAIYDSISNASFKSIAMKVDALGNVYVTGSVINNLLNGTTDIVTLKYDSNGNLLWASLYAHPIGKSDEPRAIALDNFGNVFVTGYNSDTSIVSISVRKNFITLKYNSSGVQQWAIEYNDSLELDDVANDIVVDNSGNSYVTGFSYVNSTTRDIVVIKYNSGGVQQWVAKYNGGDDDYANKLALDNSNNIVVTGSSVSTGAEDFITIKYSNAGAQQWVSIHDGAANGSDIVFDIAVDNSNNIVVTGEGDGIGTDDDFITVKYNSSGNQLWVATFNGTASGHDAASALSLDTLGNIYITGSSFNTGTDADYTTIKYNPAGVQQWAITFDGVANGPDAATDIKASANGEVYVTGYSHNGTDYDFATIKYAQDTIAISFNVTNAKCYGTSDGKIDISITGGLSPYSYQWSNGEITQNIDSLVSGLYTVTVTDYTGLTAVDFTTVNQPQQDTSSAKASLNSLFGCNDLFFSEYIEGSGKNRAVEIFNASQGCRNLSEYTIKIYPNANPGNPNLIPLNGTITPGKAYSCCHDQASNTIKGKSKMQCSCIDFDGNDAIGLYKNDTLIDIIGQIGNTPGQYGWQVGTGFTKDYTLIRKREVRSGTPYWNAAQLEYNIKTVDYSDSLGKHEGICATPTVQFVTSQSTFNEGDTNAVSVIISEASTEIVTAIISECPFTGGGGGGWFDPAATCPEDIKIASYSATTQLYFNYSCLPTSHDFPAGYKGIIQLNVYNVDDNEYDPDENYCIQITSVTGGNIGNTNTHRINITNTDPQTSVSEKYINDEVNIFPTVTSENIKVVSKNAQLIFSNLNIKNILGTTVLNIDAGLSAFDIDISRLPSGLYFVELYSLDKKFTKKIIKL